MSDALNNPVLRRGRRTGGSEADEFALGQAPDVILPAMGSVTRESEIIQSVGESVHSDQVTELALLHGLVEETEFGRPDGVEDDAADLALENADERSKLAQVLRREVGHGLFQHVAPRPRCGRIVFQARAQGQARRWGWASSRILIPLPLAW